DGALTPNPELLRCQPRQGGGDARPRRCSRPRAHADDRQRPHGHPLSTPMNVLALFGISLNPRSYLGSFIDGMFSPAPKLCGQSASNIVTAPLGFMTTTTEPIFSGGWWSSSGEAVFVR